MGGAWRDDSPSNVRGVTGGAFPKKDQRGWAGDGRQRDQLCSNWLRDWGHGQTPATHSHRSPFQPEPRLCQTVHGSPKCAVDGYDDSSHKDGSRQEQSKVPRICGVTDGCAQADGRNGLSIQVKVLGDDAGVPCSASCCNQARDQVRKNTWKDEFLPLLPLAKTKDVCGFLQVGGNGHGSGNHVKQDIPLRSQQQKNN